MIFLSAKVIGHLPQLISKIKKPYWVNASEIFEKPTSSIIEKITAVLGQDVAQNLKFKNTLKENKSDPNNIHMNHADYMIERFSFDTY